VPHRPTSSARSPRSGALSRKRSQARAESRTRLIDAALDLFGSQGFEATSTRAIAARAKVNLAAIPYYFRSKEGLYHAVAQHIAAELNALVGAERDRILESLRQAPPSPTQARAAMHALVERFAGIIVSSQAARWAPFVLREQMQPTSAFGVLYEAFMEPTHRVLSALLAAITNGDPESAETRLRVFTLLGQVTVFRAARKMVLARLGWERIEADEFDQIKRIVHENLDRIIGMETRA
jgi:AcrR family transcriptional regulator